MTDPLSPSKELLRALDQAVARRSKGGWAQADAAKSAYAVVKADAGRGAANDRLEPLARHFGLDVAGTAVLEAAAAAGYTTSLHLLTGLLNGDEKAARPTVSLVLELAGLAATDTTARALFSPLSPLVRTGLVELRGDDVLLTRRVVVDERVAAHLAGDDRPSDVVQSMLVRTVPVELESFDLLAEAISSGTSFAWIHGPLGSAGAALAAAAFEKLNAPWIVGDLRLRPNGVTPDAAARALVVEATLGGGAAIVLGGELASQEVYDDSPLPVVVVSPEPWQIGRAAGLPLILGAPRLSLADRDQLWSAVLGGVEVDREIAALRLTPEQIMVVGRHAWESARLHGEDKVTPERVRASARQLSRGRAARLETDPPTTLDELVLPVRIKSEVQRLIDWARYRDEVLARGALHGKGGKGTGIAALFAGPPGTGKTLAAHVIADELAMDLYQVELSTIVDKYIGETEKNLEKVFTAAESMNALLFFDEADALFGSRSDVKDARDRYANQEVAYLLQRMEQYDGITVLATNLRGNLDTAFARRLHFIISFPEPDEETRATLWRRHLDQAGEIDTADPVDVPMLARTVDLAGGDIRNIVLSATYAAVAAGVPLSQSHVSAAVRREYIKLGRRVPAEHIAPSEKDDKVSFPSYRSRK